MRRPLRLLAVPVAVAAVAVSLPLLSGSAGAATFSGGNVVVYRVGDGTGALTNAAAPVFLDEYTSSGTLVRSIALPTAAADGNARLTASGQSRSEGLISRSADGRFIAVTGYDAAVGDLGPAGKSLTTSDPATVRRTLGLVDGNGTVETSTALVGGPNIVRSAATTDGSRLLSAGGDGGIRVSVPGSSTGTTVFGDASSNITSLQVYGGRLFAGSILGDRLATIGTGVPTAAGATSAALTGLPSNLLTYGYGLLDLTAEGFGGTTLDTLYIANSSERGGTVDKYRYDGTTWVRAGAVDVPGAFGVVAHNVGNAVTLAVSTPSGLYVVGDADGAAATFTGDAPALLVAAGTNKEFRGVALAPAAATGPSVFLRTPAVGGSASLASAGVSVSVFADDPAGVATVTARLGSRAPVALTKTGKVWTGVVPVNGLAASTQTLSLTATSSAGTPTTTTVTRPVSLTAIAAPAGSLAPGTYSFRNKKVLRSGTWTSFSYSTSPDKAGLFNGVKSSKLTAYAYGRSVTVTLQARKTAGIAYIVVDGKSTTVNLYSATTKNVTKTFKFSAGAVKKHTVVVRVSGLKASAATNKFVYAALLKVGS